jgi:hypothetical protein
MAGPTHLGIRSSLSVLLMYLRPFLSVLFFLKLSKDFSFPGVRRWGKGCVCLLEAMLLDVEDVAFEGEDRSVEELAFEGGDRAFARLRAAEVVSVRSK